MATALSQLTDEPKHFSDCCVAVSRPLLKTLASRLPQSPALILSIGSGSGLFESLLLLECSGLNIHGVEVPPCDNIHLPEDRLMRVPCTASLHPDAILASALVFVYPRKASLIAGYLNNCLNGAVEQVVWLGHRSDMAEVREILSSAFYKLEIIEGPGLAKYEVILIADLPNTY